MRFYQRRGSDVRLRYEIIESWLPFIKFSSEIMENSVGPYEIRIVGVI